MNIILLDTLRYNYSFKELWGREKWRMKMKKDNKKIIKDSSSWFIIDKYNHKKVIQLYESNKTSVNRECLLSDLYKIAQICYNRQVRITHESHESNQILVI